MLAAASTTHSRLSSGWSAGAGRAGAIVGPVLTGLLVGADLAFPWGFYLFAVVGALGALALTAALLSAPEPAQHSALHQGSGDDAPSQPAAAPTPRRTLLGAGLILLGGAGCFAWQLAQLLC